jgi:hypothetical protein
VGAGGGAVRRKILPGPGLVASKREARRHAHRDDLAQICAKRLKVPLDAVVMRGSDTQLKGWRRLELLLNLKTAAKSLGLDVPPSLRLRGGHVIE